MPAGISFETLHDSIQIVMGWENYHLFRFAVGDFGFMREPMGYGDRDADTVIDPHLKYPNASLYYESDFGDSWRHILRVKKHLTQPLDLPVRLKIRVD